MNLLRQHATLSDLLTKELPGILNPRQAANRILQKVQNAEALVLYRDKAGDWLVLPVGHGQELHNLGQASRARIGRKTPVAYCRPDPTTNPGDRSG